MECEVLFEMKALYRDDLRVTGFRFGQGEKALAIVGAMRGNEFQQLLTCQRLMVRLQALEQQGRLHGDRQILVIPCVNPYSVNVKKRFWTIDNTDINRMFPGYSEGETTQRIAAGLFDTISDYARGIQFASFYMPGHFLPHIRVMKTGYEDMQGAKAFGLPYVVLHTPRPFDTATLNYNWQIWGTKAFSLYTTDTAQPDRASAEQAVEAILRYMALQGLADCDFAAGEASTVVSTDEMVTLRSQASGFLEVMVAPGDAVHCGQTLAEITDPFLGGVKDTVTAPVDGVVWFQHSDPMIYEDTAVMKLIPNERRLLE
ncbi:MAG: M14 family metallopeptidase [Eubacteriales bacterium]|nr:M14 family metallopeptidase [Eubacteriales bacterium]